MRRTLLIMSLICLLVLSFSAIAFAEEASEVDTTIELVEEASADVTTQESDATDEEEATEEAEESVATNDETTTEEAAESTTTEVSITPDSLLYPVKRLIESVRVALTFTEEGKAELLIEFANERLAEAQIMTEQNKLELAEKVIQVYAKTIAKANDHVVKGIEKDKDLTSTIEKFELIQDNADKVIIKFTGAVSEEIAEQLKEKITVETQKVLAKKAFITAKENFFDAKK
ncbi:MAG: DUF5667 domain-containing protein, partial [Bacillota bacterium]|nr:DUF5667 domain-containing protein [Bacillota bacterium]